MIRKIVSALHPMGARETAHGQEQRTVPRSVLTRSEHPPQNYDDEPDAREAIALVVDHTMLSYPRLVTLWQQVRYLDRAGIEGCHVECGTWKGGAAALMGLAHRRSGEACRNLHVFDSFQGLPEPDRAHDGEMAVRYA